MNLQDWGGLGELCDPVSLRLFKQEILDQAETTFRRFGKSAAEELFDAEEEDLGFDPYEGFIDAGECLSHELADVTTVEQLREMDPARVFARWIQAKTRRQRRILEPDNESWQAPAESPPFITAQVFSFTILGCVMDDAGLAHVLYRNDRNIPPAAAAHRNDIKSAADEDDELQRILCVRSYPVTALCRKQADGSWRLIASSSLYLVPTVELIDATRE